MSGARRTFAATVAALLVGVISAVARATCPPGPVLDPEECEPFVAAFVPGATGLVYRPSGGDVWLYGGGFELVSFTWANSSQSFGPANGKLRLTLAVLDSDRSAPDAGGFYRTGAVFSVEKNPARSFLIPFVAGDIGVLDLDNLDARVFVDGGIGAYLVYLPGFMLDLEASYLLSFRDREELSGFKAHLTASVPVF